jgi:hypothetical protein
MLSAGAPGETPGAGRAGHGRRGRRVLEFVAACDARELTAGDQDEVEERACHPDHALDPAAAGKLGGAANRHGARL